MGSLLSTSKYSYHIYKKFGDDVYLAYWPSSGFGQYCTDLSTAEQEFDKESKNGSCRLIRHKTVIEDGHIIGVIAGGDTLKEC